jgi:hypothetical protein
VSAVGESSTGQINRCKLLVQSHSGNKLQTLCFLYSFYKISQLISAKTGVVAVPIDFLLLRLRACRYESSSGSFVGKRI